MFADTGISAQRCIREKNPLRTIPVPVHRTPYHTTPAEPISAPFGARWWWTPDLAFLALRAVVGLLLARHGAHALFGVLALPGEGWSGVPVPWTEPWIDGVALVLAGALVTVGLFTRVAALVLAVLVALTHLTGPGRGQPLSAGWEVAALYTLILLAFVATGPGMFSIEYLVQITVSRRRRRDTVSLSPWVRKQYRRRELAR